MESSSLGVRGLFCLCIAATMSCGHKLAAQPSNGTPSRLTPATTPASAEQRLASQSCDEFAREQRAAMEAELRAMRAQLAEELANWRAEQPDCWQEYQRNAEYWKQLRERGNLWGDELGESYGVGGLGLSGIGEGGGGRGEGIALGSVGASDAGQRLGAGQSGLGESHRARTSATNVQVQGVDEADIVKTDGQHVYFALNGALRIAAVDPPRLVSVTALPGKVKELFLYGERAVVYVALGGSGQPSCTYGYDCEVRGDGSRTKLFVLDVKRPASPIILRSFELSGSLVAARRIDNSVHTVVVDGERPSAYLQTWPDPLPRCGVYEATVKAQLARLARANEQAIRAAHSLPTLTENGQSRTFCAEILRDPSEQEPAFTTIYSFDLSKDHGAIHGKSLLSRPGTVYASREALYVAVRKSRGFSAGEQSTLHKFRLGKLPEQTAYLASGKVPGHVLNQFALDEWQSNLRVATTLGRVPDPAVESQVTVLGERSGTLVELGAVKHLARGEDIRSVRFDAERAYVVTFKKTDPLFVLDFGDASAPKLLGELKIPGFSTYLHRIDPNHLISIGFDAEDRGDFAYFNGLLLQLFDVTRPTQPKLLHREILGTRGSGSEAATNHLAFNYLAEDGLLAIPSILCEGGGNGAFGRLTFAGLLIYEVSVDKGFRRLGGINHGSVGARCDTWWSNSTSTVKRSLFLDDQVWSIATDRAKVQKLTALGRDYGTVKLSN